MTLASDSPDAGLTHLDDSGSARMVDVGDKHVTVRRARARAMLRMSPHTASVAASGDLPKGDVVSITRIAAIQAAKQTASLIPLAHPLVLDHIDVDVDVAPDDGVVTIECSVRTSGRTGVEMEAMAGCSVGALTFYDMVKGIERGVVIESIALLSKSGGRNDWVREGSDS